jgi:hypothetical protein
MPTAMGVAYEVPDPDRRLRHSAEVVLENPVLMFRLPVGLGVKHSRSNPRRIVGNMKLKAPLVLSPKAKSVRVESETNNVT